jgi:hypothetical protein
MLLVDKTSNVLIMIYNYVTKYTVKELCKVEFINYTNVYNNSISKLIDILYKIKYTPKIKKQPVQPIQFHEDCIYY